ncbi:flippase [Patescibacteria group bacterium]|nr:MAG: flippase [Patescibacteria group bacterium]
MFFEKIEKMVLAVVKRVAPAHFSAAVVSDGFKRYFLNTSWNFVGKIAGLFISFFVSVYVVRYLGPHNYGLLSYVLSFVGLFSFITNLGVDNILLRELVKTPEKQNELFGSALFLRFAGAAAAILLIIFFIQFTNNDFYTNLLIIFASLSFIFQSFQIIYYHFQAKVLSKKATLNAVFIGLFLSGVKLLFIFLKLKLIYFVGVFVLESVVYAVSYIVLYKKQGLSIFNWSFNRFLAVAMLKDSWPLMLASAFAFAYSRIDQVMLKNMMSAAAVGLYDAGVRLSEFWYFVPVIIVGSIFPAIVNAKKTDELIYRRRLAMLYSLIIYVSFLVILPLYFFAEPVIKILYGSQFLESVSVLKIYIWAGFAVSLGTVINQYLLVENLTRVSLYINCIGMLANVLLNLLFIPRYGTSGAALATLISYSLIPLSILFFKKTRPHARSILFGFLLKRPSV